MFPIMLGASLTFGAALLAAVLFTDGALVALRTAAQAIGWLLVLATLVGLAGLRRASPDRVGAVSVALCSGLAVLYMSYFLEWSELPRPAMRHAAAETSQRPFSQKELYPAASMTLAAVQATRPAEDRASAKTAAPRSRLKTATLPAALAAHPCSALTGVELLQCDRCADTVGFAWVACAEKVRLEFCDSEVGEERICPSPIPSSYPG